MRVTFASALFIIVILQTLTSGAMCLDLVPLSNSPINTSSGVVASLHCTKDSNEIYAVCASNANTAIKYNLQPFSLAVKGPNQGNYMLSCDLYETSSQSTSLAVCAKSNGGNGIVYFHRVSDMINITNLTVGTGITGNYPHVVVDTPNQIAFFSNHFNTPPIIYKITNIVSSTPVASGNMNAGVSLYPAAMLITGGFLFVHFDVSPALLLRVNISTATTFDWTQILTFASGESNGWYDNLASDDTYIYDLTYSGVLVRCTYKNNNFARLDGLNTGYTSLYSLEISPDKRTLFVTCRPNNVLQMVNVSSFALFGNTPTVPSPFGRPIITSWCNVYVFAQNSDFVYAFRLNSSSCPRTPSASRSASLSASSSTETTMTASDSVQNSASNSISSSISSSAQESDSMTISDFASTTQSSSNSTIINNAPSSSNTSTSTGSEEIRSRSKTKTITSVQPPSTTTTSSTTATQTSASTSTSNATATVISTMTTFATASNVSNTSTSTTIVSTTTAPPPTIVTTSTTTTTTTQTSLAPVTQITYAPLPSTLNDTVIQVNTSNVQPDSPLVNVSIADNLNNISQILQALQTQQMQATNAQGITFESLVIPSTKLFVPYQGLGEFIIKPTLECKYNSKLDFRLDSSGTSVQILATSSGSTADVEYAVKNCVAFNPSQATIDRNISAQKFLGVQIQSGTEQATTAMALNSIVFNHGPISNVLTHNCSTNVPRGSRFIVDLGFVFTHALGLPMTITATGADLFPLPTTIKSVQNSSGFVTVRGTISDTEPLAILFIATDSLTPAVQAICTITPVFINLHLKNPMMVPYEIHAGIDFNFYIPSDMFESSSPFWIDYVTQQNGLPLPNGVSFQKPWSIAGRMPAVGLFNWTAFAADDFNEARGYILINSTNSAPRVAVSEPHDLGLAFAARDMSLEIDLSALFVDSDNDAVKYYMNTTELAQIPWLRANVAPGGFTKTPQKLTLTGSVPRTARGTNLTLQLFCSDGYNETVLVTVLRIAQGARPIQIKALPSYTIAPEEVLSEQLAMSDYFVLPDGDQMIVTYTLQPVVTWVTITNNPGAGGAPPTLAVAASVTQIEDTEDFVIVTVSNALGDSVNATISIYVRQTQWQKIQALIIGLSAAIGFITSVVGTVVYWPHIVNAIHGRKVVKKCPLHHTTPRFQFPDETDRFECSVRGTMMMCGHDLYKGIAHISHYLSNHLSQKPTPNSGPPDWLSVRDRHIVLELPPPPKDDVGVKIVLCRFWKKQNFLIEEFEVNFDECYEGYVYDENQIARNEMLTSGKENAIAIAMPLSGRPPAAASNAKVNALELELSETKALQEATDRRVRRQDQEMARQRAETQREMIEMRRYIKELLEGGGGKGGDQRRPNPLFVDDEFTTAAPSRNVAFSSIDRDDEL